MRKSTKLAVMVAVAALLVACFAMTSFAVNKGWDMLDGQWVYYENTDGDLAYNEFKKSADGNYYYLGDEGYMVVDQLVYYDGYTYYVDATGKRVVNNWVQIPADDVDEELGVSYRWYRFGSSGKAVTFADCTADNHMKTINGKKYSFDTDGKMLFGFVKDGAILTGEDAVLSADLYFGSNEDGSAQTLWYECFEDLTAYGDHNWFYFKNGVKYTSAKEMPIKINSKYYDFNEDGVMTTEWGANTKSSASTKSWYGPIEDGSLHKKTWIYTVAKEDEGKDDPSSHWFWADSEGQYVYDTVRKINGKWYAFKSNGVMAYSLVKVAAGKDLTDCAENGQVVVTSANKDSVKKYLADVEGYDVYFFSSDEVADGSLKSGTHKFTLGDDEVTMLFEKSGKAVNDIKNNKIYVYGILQTAGEERYTVVTFNGKNYVISASGAILRDGGTARNADGEWYAVTTDGAKIALMKDKDYASNAASAFAQGKAEFVVGGKTYQVKDFIKTEY